MPGSCDRDLDCCVAAWQGEAKLVRVHDDDTSSCGPLLASITGHLDHGKGCMVPPGVDVTLAGFSRFIVLSAGFAGVSWVEQRSDGQRSVSYTSRLKMRLKRLGTSVVAVPLVDGARGYVLAAEWQAQQE